MPETTRDDGQERKYGPEQQQNIDVMNLFRLDGRVAVVTGGAGIYGFIIATALAEAGASVVIASRTLAKCEEKAAELRACGYRAVAMPLDLASDESIVALREQVLAEFGQIDILFNNAAGRVAGSAEELIKRGYAAPKATMDGMTRSQWEGAMAINASGLFMCSQVFAEQMRTQGRGGSIVNISSIYGVVGPTFSIYAGTQMANPPDYAFAKGGIVNFTRSSPPITRPSASAPIASARAATTRASRRPSSATTKTTHPSVGWRAGTILRARRSSWPRMPRSTSPVRTWGWMAAGLPGEELAACICVRLSLAGKLIRSELPSEPESSRPWGRG